jgi:para-nitrobenzyl esterase
VFPQDVYSIFAAGKQNDVPLIVGSVADDTPGPGTAPTKAADVPAYAQNTFRELAGKYLKLYPATTDAEASKSAHAFRTNSALASARTWARLQAQTGKSKVYWYYFSHVSPMPKDLIWGGRPALDWGAYHGSEIVYVFNAFPLQDWDWRPVDRKLGDTISSIWTNFVKTGSPNGAGLPEWPSFDPKTDGGSQKRGQNGSEVAPFPFTLDIATRTQAFPSYQEALFRTARSRQGRAVVGRGEANP